ncbi:MAG TPA: hypothetical protein VFO85_06430, partial [Vicinamibacteria bacterium]|nr:hypothetical protein [Vicinamibacteria bacterium]
AAMPPPPGEEEREEVARALQRVREGVADRALVERRPADVLPAAAPVRTPQAAPPRPEPPLPAPPARPDTAALNTLWRTAEAVAGRAARLGRRLLGPLLYAQERFNSAQVQFDNAVLDYLDARLAHTHAHYDAVLGVHGRHMGEIDERHLILQEELVAHVHDLVRRIDLVLEEGERGRVAHESALREVRSRLALIEERLRQA